MPNDYTSAYAPMQSNAQYGQPLIIGQGQQEAMHQAMLQQQQQYNNQAAQTAGSNSPMGSLASGGMNAMMLANALRAGMPQGDNSTLGARMDMALNSQASPYLQNQVSQLGSSTSNPFSNYNMGTGGFGNYGE
jgi:hypothetical protein